MARYMDNSAVSLLRFFASSLLRFLAILLCFGKNTSVLLRFYASMLLEEKTRKEQALLVEKLGSATLLLRFYAS